MKLDELIGSSRGNIFRKYFKWLGGLGLNLVSNYQIAQIIQELIEANFQFFTLEMVNWAIKIG